MVTPEPLRTVTFGDEPTLANHLAHLVLSGIKRATCSAASEGMLAKAGQKIILLDGAGSHRAILEVTSTMQKRFCDVDENFAFEEGEGNRSLSFWQAEHKRYFSKIGQFSPEMLLNCECFRLLKVIR